MKQKILGFQKTQKCNGIDFFYNILYIELIYLYSRNSVKDFFFAIKAALIKYEEFICSYCLNDEKPSCW